MNSSCCHSPHLDRSSTSTYEMRSSCSPERDIALSKLKAQLFEYEQNEKNYYQLQSKYRNLQNDLQLLSEEKLRLEYELRQKTEQGSVSLGELKKDNEDILNELNEKIAMNKRLYNDNNNLFRTLESKAAENSSLKEQVREQEELIANISNEKSAYEEQIAALSHKKQKGQCTLSQMNEEIEGLRLSNAQLGQDIKRTTDQNVKVIEDIDQSCFENKTLKGKLNVREETLAATHNQLELANKAIAKLDNDYNTLKRSYTMLQGDLDNNRSNITKENSRRMQIEQSNEELENVLKERTEEIKRLGQENEAIKMSLGKLGDDKAKLNGEMSQYKNHIQLLTEQNMLLGEELEFILQRDQKLLAMLNRSQKLGYVVEQNNRLIENSLDTLKQYMDNKKDDRGSSQYRDDNSNSDNE